MLSRWKEAVGTTSPLAVFAVTSWHFLEAGDRSNKKGFVRNRELCNLLETFTEETFVSKDKCIY